VLDNDPIHVSKATLAALAAREHWLTAEWLPKYAPELNTIRPAWRDLKAHHLAHHQFQLGRELSGRAKIGGVGDGRGHDPCSSMISFQISIEQRCPGAEKGFWHEYRVLQRSILLCQER
jgi:hypothetical protein